MTAEEYRWPSRIGRAVMVAIFNALLWIAVPSLLAQLLGSEATTSPIPLNTSLIYVFGITITALQGLGELVKGTGVAVPFKSGSYIAEAFFIWSAADGGLISFNATGVGIRLAFQPLLFLLMLPSLFSSVKAPLVYLLEETEAASPASDAV